MCARVYSGAFVKLALVLYSYALMLKPLRILIVDDDNSILELVSAYLTAKGHEVTVSASGPDGLSTVESNSFDLVISDVHMAGINGFELLHATRELYPDIGFVLMTAYEECYPLSEALEAGADGYISKPFTLAKFSLIFERAYWAALARQDWWDQHTTPREETPGTFGL